MIFIQDPFVRYYDYRPFRSTFLNKIIGNSSKICGILGQRLLPWCFNLYPGTVLEKGKRSSIIVTMTSFPARIGNVWIVLESLLRQQLQPKQVWLYLSEVQFIDRALPENLNRYIENDFLKIIWVKDDYRSYKKFWYFVKDCPSESFITLDDDIIYQSNIISSLIEEREKYPNYVLACYCYKIQYNTDGSLKPYRTWCKKTKKGDIGNRIFFGSGGGTYFPSGCLEGADVDYEIIKRICPLADDIWLNAFVRCNGYHIACVKERRSVVSVLNKQNITLSHENLEENKNDIQLDRTIKFFIKEFNVNPFK